MSMTEGRSWWSLTEFLLRGDDLVSDDDEARRHALCRVNARQRCVDLNRRIAWQPWS